MSPREKIREFISETFFVDDFGEEESFLRNRIIDSSGMMELVAFLEVTFSIRVDDTELVPENLDSLQRVCAFVERKQNAS